MSRISQRFHRRSCAIAVIASALCASPALAQRAPAIAGTITAANGGAPLADAMVAVDGVRKGAVSDGAGRYRIDGLTPGDYTLVVQRIGYAVVRKPLHVDSATVRADFALAEAATVLAPTVVSASRERQGRSEASATIDVLDGAEIRRSSPAHPGDVMNRIPGVHVIELSGEGHMTSIRQPITTKPVYLYLEDGVPTRATGFFNHNALYEVNIPQSAGIEVLKGPGTALYGSDAIGGVVNVLTRPAPQTPSLEASLEGGAYGWKRLLASGGTTVGANGLRADLNVTSTDGWRDAASYERQMGTLRWDAVGSDGWTAKSVVSASKIHQVDAYTLNQAQFDDRSPINRSPITYRDVQALRLSTAIEKESGASLWSFTPYARHNVLDLMPSWQLSYDPQLWSTRNNSLGALAKYRRDFEPMRARIITGADVDWSPGSFTAQQVIASKSGTGAAAVWSAYSLGETQYDYDVTYRALSPYVQGELSPLPRLRLDAGVRYDAAGYTYHNRLSVDQSPASAHRRPADTSVTYYHLSPKLGATLDVGGGANVFASYRHGFRAPAQSQLFQQNSADNTVGLKPVTVDSYETGVRGSFASRLLYELSLYDMTLSDDILTFVTAANTREARNAGKSRYRGVEGALGVAVTPSLRVDASWSVSSQRYVSYVPQAAQPASGTTAAKPAIVYSGNLVEQAPRDVGNIMVAWSAAFLHGGRLAAEFNHTGRYAEDPANTHYYGGHDLLNLHASYVVTARGELFLRLMNVTNRNYAELVAYDQFQGTQYNPGSPRSLYAGVRVNVGR